MGTSRPEASVHSLSQGRLNWLNTGPHFGPSADDAIVGTVGTLHGVRDNRGQYGFAWVSGVAVDCDRRPNNDVVVVSFTLGMTFFSLSLHCIMDDYGA